MIGKIYNVIMNKLLVTMIVLLLIGGCSTNWNFENTGLAKEHFDGNMYEYLKSDSYNWDSIRLIIERAELVPLFEGEDPITFIGPTNHSVRKWMNDKFINCINDIDKDACIKIVKDHLFAGKILRDDIPQGKYLTQEGGDVYTTLSGKSIWMGLFYEDYGNVVEGGVRVIYLKEDVTIDIASSNIQPTNGVVHSLSYNYVLGGL